MADWAWIEGVLAGEDVDNGQRPVRRAAARPQTASRKGAVSKMSRPR